MQINLMYHDVFCRDINESGFERERDLPYKMKVDTFEDHVKNISEYCATEGLSKDNIVFTFSPSFENSERPNFVASEVHAAF